MEERKTKVATKLALAASRSQTQSLHLINLEFDDSWALNYETFLKQEDAKIIDEFVQRMWTDQLTNPFLSCSNETDVLLMIERYAQIVPEQIGSLAILYVTLHLRLKLKYLSLEYTQDVGQSRVRPLTSSSRHCSTWNKLLRFVLPKA